MREAADEGNTRALFEIGWMTYFGLGCRRSVSEARRLVETAVDRGILNTLTGESVTGNPYSQLRLGWLYDLGWGVEHSPYKAITWYTGAKIMGLMMADALIARVNYGLSRPGT